MTGVPNHMTWPTNNPNGIQPSGFATSHGAIGTYAGAQGPIAIFPTYASGRAAAIVLWSTDLSNHQSLGGAIRNWTGETSSQIPSYYQAIYDALNATSATATSSLTAAAVQAAQQTAEGWAVGTVTCSGSGGK